MGDTVAVKTQTITTAGGTVTVTDATSPLNGLSITFPANAVIANTTVNVGYADIDSGSSQLPSETNVVSKMLVLSSDATQEFNKPITITLPYDKTKATYNEFVNPYEYVSVPGATIGTYKKADESRIEVASITNRDTAAGTMTFMVRHFSNYFILEWAKKVADVLSTSADFNVDTGFDPAVDGWVIPNYGSILNPGGNCIGMSSYAKWFFTWKDVLSDSSGLYSKYIQGNQWYDDVCAIEIASRMQSGERAIWTESSADMNAVGMSSLEVAKSFVQAMSNTGQPQIMYLDQAYDDGTTGGAHAILVRAYSNGVFKLYDPNFPGDETRQVGYTYGGNWSIYNSGTNAASNRFKYNEFGIVGSSVFHNFDDAQNIYNMANTTPCFSGGSLFPTITLTSPAADTNGNINVTSTSENGTTLIGTITGGQKQPTHTIIYVNGTKYDVNLPASGAFSQKVPLYCAETSTTDETINLNSTDNVVEFLVTASDAWQNYAGYARYIVSCTGPTPLAKVTLTWDTPLDLDLHLVSPITHTGIGYGETNYQSQTVNTLPYLDYDDTTGTGPEHMFFNSALTGIEQGTYTVNVVYFSAHGASPVPVVGYTVVVETGVLLDGVPLYDSPEYYYGTLTTEGELQTVTTFDYSTSAAAKTMTEGKQGI
jgi:uncharacterized protein YfaP (DUF2135 family)